MGAFGHHSIRNYLKNEIGVLKSPFYTTKLKNKRNTNAIHANLLISPISNKNTKLHSSLMFEKTP
jgi:hypothetical protein